MDRGAEFRELYDAHRTAVHAYFTGRTGDRWLAADLMQETFLRAWRRFPELSGLADDGQRAWLFTVARNLSIDEHRHSRTRAAADAVLRAEPVEVAAPASASVLAAERVAVVAETIKRLPEPQRVALTLAAAGGLTSAEIATALGVPAGTVRYRLSLARRTLAEALSTYDDVEQ
ncbi:RNA polymerase sigma factor [Paractinoplanes lichenicola]|uniref:RNA polymerase sigma factor n=1 Tax=Paractinoplanes lichenicola TaxID=2802976 RepID=A0ABS1VMC9_9ACTN|nr:RNA polymerase sigma factor [Actinoplanes lichenicola]MBL7255748.1 RNA polymerase sigma factor [Actinoplanes lichenicola]